MTSEKKLKPTARQIVRETCAPNGCAYAAVDRCQMIRSATSIVTDFRESGCHIAAKSVSGEIVYSGMPNELVIPGVMTVQGFTPLGEEQITFRDHIRGSKPVSGRQVVFDYANL